MYMLLKYLNKIRSHLDSKQCEWLVAKDFVDTILSNGVNKHLDELHPPDQNFHQSEVSLNSVTGFDLHFVFLLEICFGV